MARIAINGFGRIGRLFFRQAFISSVPAIAGAKADAFDIIAINDLADIENVAYLLRHDTVYWGYDKSVAVAREGNKNYLIVEGKKILVTQEKAVAKLPWKDLQVDIVVEATGLFQSFAAARAHIAAGAQRVVMSAPAEDAEQADAKTVLLGVNEKELATCVISSHGSCTTNATHPLAAIMLETVGVEKAMMTTVHGYTATQSLVDGITKLKDFRRGRAAGANIVPSGTGATISVVRALPALQGKFEGFSVRVPVITGSLVDFSFIAGRPTNTEEINGIFKKAAGEERWQGVLAVSDEPLVSSDIIGMPYGAIVDMSCTKVVGGNLVKVLSWYDNEWGYAATLVRHVQRVAEAMRASHLNIISSKAEIYEQDIIKSPSNLSEENMRDDKI